MIAARNFGTALGPHIMRDGERTARPCTLCTRTNRPPTVCDLGKWVTAIYWGVKWSQVQILSARRRSEDVFASGNHPPDRV